MQLGSHEFNLKRFKRKRNKNSYLNNRIHNYSKRKNKDFENFGIGLQSNYKTSSK